MTIAIVTGASSGLGREFVKQLADEGGCAEIWAIARPVSYTHLDVYKRQYQSWRCH